MEENKTAIILTIVTIVVIILAGVILYNITNANTSDMAEVFDTINIENLDTNSINENLIGNYIVTTNADEEKVSPNAKITFYRKYKDCNHTIKEKTTVEESIVNLTEDEIRKLYNDWKLLSFSNNLIELYKEVPGECGEHYIVRENNGRISVYKVSSYGDDILMEETDIEIEYLPDIDKENLKNGVKIIGKEELNSYLENFE